MRNTIIMTAFVFGSAIFAGNIAKAADANVDDMINKGIISAQKAQAKAQDRLAMFQGCKTDPKPCIALTLDKAQKAAKRAQAKLDIAQAMQKDIATK